MKKIVILDTWVNDTNLGNKIIMEAVCNKLRGIFPHDFFYQVPALEFINSGRNLTSSADYIFLAGTNLLRSDMNKKQSDWALHFTDIFWLKRVILIGVGWWQYQSNAPNLYTRFLLHRILNRNYLQSVRDSYTAKRVEAMGFRTLNTGCPTIWNLHSVSIPQTRSERALLTFTEYNKNPEADRLLFEIVQRNYSTIYFWPQQYGDYHYARRICNSKLIVIDPSLEALDGLLRCEDVDYVGTRLHAGIRALQHRRRVIIIAIDNRAIEMGKDFHLPVLPREEIAARLEGKINSTWKTEIKISQQAVDEFTGQFINSGQKREV